MPQYAENSNVEKALRRFASNVPSNAKKSLLAKRNKLSIRSKWKKVGGDWIPQSQVRKNFLGNTYASGQLANSLTGRIEGKTIIFEMEYYGQWVDAGRKPSEKYPPPARIRKWVDIRKLSARSSDGKFAKVSKKSLAFLIGRKIKTFGIPPTHFFTNAFRRALDKLPNDVYDALADDFDIKIEKLNSQEEI